MSYDTVIVGCGQIAGGYDDDRDLSCQPPLSHAGAFHAHPAFRNSACIDPEPEVRRRFAERWSIPSSFASVEDWLATSPSCDVISVCTPSAGRAELIQRLLSVQPRLIFAEKPLDVDFSAGQSAMDACRRAGVPLAVNYFRRWGREINRLREGLEQAGALQSAYLSYGGGLFNNGSHLLDLLGFLTPGIYQPVWAKIRDSGGDPADPRADAVLKAGDAMVFLSSLDRRNYVTIEMSLAFEGGIAEIQDLGTRICWRPAGNDPRFPLVRTPRNAEWHTEKDDHFMAQVVDGLFRTLDEGAPLPSTAQTALVATRLCQEIVALAEAT
ncbi:Gfo/Idh/MocA family oxidoreductase [Thalassospiraceae bacterium LMO-JJ14]|nr:Gfo/Idh/MocA family oxidoreductase [Thalassospiraceae bacterium LMO-JJ14]